MNTAQRIAVAAVSLLLLAATPSPRTPPRIDPLPGELSLSEGEHAPPPEVAEQEQAQHAPEQTQQANAEPGPLHAASDAEEQGRADKGSTKKAETPTKGVATDAERLALEESRVHATWIGVGAATGFGVLAFITTCISLCVAKRATRISILANRPYLLVDKATLLAFETPDPYPEDLRDSHYRALQVRFDLTNFGKGPAVVNEIRVRLKLMEPGNYPSARYFDPDDCRPLRVKGPSDWRAADFRKVIKPDGDLDILTDEAEGPSDLATRDLITRNTKMLVAYGVVRYRDVFGESYETGFCWVYNPLTAFMYAHPEPNNYST